MIRDYFYGSFLHHTCIFIWIIRYYFYCPFYTTPRYLIIIIRDYFHGYFHTHVYYLIIDYFHGVEEFFLARCGNRNTFFKGVVLKFLAPFRKIEPATTWTNMMLTKFIWTLLILATLIDVWSFVLRQTPPVKKEITFFSDAACWN